jgi:hypothetical protein
MDAVSAYIEAKAQRRVFCRPATNRDCLSTDTPRGKSDMHAVETIPNARRAVYKTHQTAHRAAPEGRLSILSRSMLPDVPPGRVRT